MKKNTQNPNRLKQVKQPFYTDKTFTKVNWSNPELKLNCDFLDVLMSTFLKIQQISKSLQKSHICRYLLWLIILWFILGEK